jgi:EAL domain-containing protein (putative c-di-GMP-specific phosphodiesterase class I)
LDVIAEGIENPAQAEELRALGCKYAQGFLFSKPLTAKAMETLLASGPILHAAGLPAPPL